MTMASGVYGQFLEDMGNNTKAFDLTDDTIKYVFVNDTETPNFDTDEFYSDVSANEVTGAGYTTGGETLGTPSWTAASGFATFDAADVDLSTTTLTDVRGIVLIDSTLTNDLIMAMTFGADYSTILSSFQITWAATGIWRASYT